MVVMEVQENKMVTDLLNFYKQLNIMQEEALASGGSTNEVPLAVNTMLQFNHAKYCQQAIECRLNNLGVYLVDGEWMQRMSYSMPPVEKSDGMREIPTTEKDDNE